MHWDLLEEHKEAYDAVVCKKIDEEYKDKMQRKFDLSLDLEKKETASIYEA